MMQSYIVTVTDGEGRFHKVRLDRETAGDARADAIHAAAEALGAGEDALSIHRVDTPEGADMTLEELRASGLGHGAFNLGYGEVAAGDRVEGGVHDYDTGQALEVFPDGECWVQWDHRGFETVKWRYVRKIGEPT